MYPTILDGQLWQWLCKRTESALAVGALQHIATQELTLLDGNIPFSLRIAKNLQRKKEDKLKGNDRTAEFNPFLPPEPDLTVGAIGEQHLAVLNKFNVVAHHLLIVTRLFEPQEALLTLSDFEALCWSLREIDGLGFYNGGKVAGASQRHKHLQLIPLPLNSNQSGLPVEQIFPPELAQQTHRLHDLPFPHRIAALSTGLFNTPADAAEQCHRLYRDMLQALHIKPLIKEGNDYQSAPYNLLLTRRWLMVVPRTREHIEGISINALGFAGSLFVKNEEERKRTIKRGPLQMLRAVCRK